MRNRALAAERFALAVTKSVLNLSALTLGLCLSGLVVAVCYGAIIAQDVIWFRLSHYFNLLIEPRTARSVALVIGGFGIFFAHAWMRALERWIDTLPGGDKGAE